MYCLRNQLNEATPKHKEPISDECKSQLRAEFLKQVEFLDIILVEILILRSLEFKIDILVVLTSFGARRLIYPIFSFMVGTIFSVGSLKGGKILPYSHSHSDLLFTVLVGLYTILNITLAYFVILNWAMIIVLLLRPSCINRLIIYQSIH